MRPIVPFLAASAGLLLSAPHPMLAATLSFQPDYRCEGSRLQEWRPLGKAAWSAKDGEVDVSAQPGSGGGWLLFQRSYQDVGVHLSFRCTGECNLGVMVRGEALPDGDMKGIYIPLRVGENGSYRVVMDANGAITSQEKLAATAGVVRMATPSPATRSQSGAGRQQQAPSTLPLTRPQTEIRAGDWNEAEVFVDANAVRTFINNGGESAGIAEESAGRSGLIAFHLAGPGEVRIKDIAVKDLAVKTAPPEGSSPYFRAQRINDMFFSWGAAAGDFNHDGVLDVVAGPYIYFGPKFERYQEIFSAPALSPSNSFPSVNCEYAFDFNGDGWTDILTGPPTATLYLNPNGKSERWEAHVVVPKVQSEITVFRDIDGDAVPEFIYASEGTVRYARADRSHPTEPWTVHIVSEPGLAAVHGIGAGDVNGDGRVDIVNPYGWWEQPRDPSGAAAWNYHPAAFGRYGRNTMGGAAMGVYDVNGDGLSDVVTGLNAHGFGLAWFEQKRSATGGISFVQHMISDDYSTPNAGNVVFSQAHGATFADTNGDGILDFVVGKRYWTHLDSYHDPDPFGLPVLYSYQVVRTPDAPGGAKFVPELIHNRSGAGSDIAAADLNRDGAMDVITSTDRGTFIFWGKPRAPKKPGQASHLR